LKNFSDLDKDLWGNVEDSFAVLYQLQAGGGDAVRIEKGLDKDVTVEDDFYSARRPYV